MIPKHPRYSAPKRFYELDLALKFESDAARERLIERLQNLESNSLSLAKIMLNLSQDAVVKFPERCELPVSDTDIENISIEQLDGLIGDDKTLLEVTTADEQWVMDAELKEPVKLKDIEQAQDA